MNALSTAPTHSPSSAAGEFWLHRAEDRSGPFTLAQLRAQVAAWQILPEDEIEIAANAQRLSGHELMKTARFLEKDPVLRHAEAAALITSQSVLAKERVIRIADIESIQLILPDPPKEKILSKMDRTLIWALGILFFWTLLAPIVAWYLTRRDFKEEGLGIVHGILLRGRFGEDLLILDGLGVLPPGHPHRAHLEQIAALLHHLKSAS